jgi:PAS domain S-box-containing protein
MLGNTAELQAYLEKQPILQMLFNAGAFVTLADGNPIADVPVPAKRLGLSVAERDYVVTALQEGRSSIGKPVIGKNLKTPVFSVAAPIRDAQGRVQGVLVGVTSLNAQNFLDNVTRQRYGKTGDYFVASRAHRLNVTSSDKNRIMQELPKPGVNPYVDRFVQGYEGSVRYFDQRGIEILVSVKGIPVANWAMVATLPTAEAFAPIHSLQLQLLLATLLLSLLAGGATWWMTGWLVKRQLSPMLDATRTLATMTEIQHPVVPLPVTSQDEIGELIGGFNLLLKDLEKREIALRDSEAYNKVLFAESHIPLAVIDPETGRLVDCNQAIVEIYGLKSREAVFALSPNDVATPLQYDGRVSAEAAYEKIEYALHNGPTVFEWRHRRPNGEIWDAEVHLMPFKHGDKTLLQFSLEDITERKRIDRELHESEM